MEIRELKTFKSVAMLLSFNRAAEKLNYAQSSVSAQIKSLEEELAVKLFDRLGRRIRLTEAGERLIQYADKILESAICAPNGGNTQRWRFLVIKDTEIFGIGELKPKSR